MCRAVWVIVVAPTDEACKALRRAAGAEVQVVAMATSLDELRGIADSTPSDVLVLDASTPGARDVDAAGRALVWVGTDAPPSAHADTTELEEVESAITRALIQRSKR